MYNRSMKLGGILRHGVLLGVLTLSFVAAFMLAPVQQLAAQTEASTRQACEAIGGTWSGDACQSPGGAPDLDNVIASIVNILTVVVAIVAVIMIIWGGFKYITAAGDSNKVSSAKNTIIYAIIGLAIVALAQAFVAFVLQQTA